MPVDLATISGYLDADKALLPDSRAREERHRRHIGEAMAESEAVRSGDLGAAYAETFRAALDAVQWVIEKAKDEANLEVILTAAKVAGEIGEMQAKVADAIPSRGRGRPTKEDIAERTPIGLTDEDIEAGLREYKATKS